MSCHLYCPPISQHGVIYSKTKFIHNSEKSESFIQIDIQIPNIMIILKHSRPKSRWKISLAIGCPGRLVKFGWFVSTCQTARSYHEFLSTSARRRVAYSYVSLSPTSPRPSLLVNRLFSTFLGVRELTLKFK